MYIFSFKRCISIVFILMILFINIFSCYSVAYADSQSSGGHFGSKTDLSVYNKIYDGFDFSDTIAKHESFYFNDSVGNKHAVARVGSAWICLFGSRATFNGSQDDLLNYYLSYYAYTGYSSISNSFCALMASQLGSITKGGYTLVENALSSNIKNVADNITYNESDDSISLNNSAVDKLREEIKEYYYESLGVCLIKSSGKPSDGVYQIRSSYDDIDEYNHDLTAANDFDYAFFTSTTDVSDAYTLAMFNKKDISYLYAQIDTSSYFSHCYSLMFSDDGVSSFYLFSKMKYFYNYYNTADLGDYYSNYYYTQDSFVGYGIDMRNLPYISSIYPCYIKGKDYANNPAATRIYKLYRHSDYFSSAFYSKDGSPLVVFKSQSALYNYIQGDQSAYLSKTINNIGEDITFSINDMSDNLGEKMDTLIDSINDKKGSMSADELQSAIDKGLEDISKNTEDIKDNTSDILDVLREQNQILLDILGVTTNIYKVVKESDSKEKTYNINYVQSVFNSMFKGLKNAVLYGENTVRDDVSEDTDDIDSIVSDISPDKKNYHNGLFGRFPFSVPYQLFDWLQALYVEPVAPKFTLSYAYLFKDLGYETNNFEFVIDLGDEKYSKWIELVRSGEKLSFIIYMAIATYHRFKNEI